MSRSHASHGEPHRTRSALRVLARAGRAVWQIPGLILIMAVRLYQYLISPLLGTNCRFEPSCSRYFIASVEKYGAVRGALRGLARIARCHPFSRGGYDPP